MKLTCFLEDDSYHPCDFLMELINMPNGLSVLLLYFSSFFTRKHNLLLAALPVLAITFWPVAYISLDIIAYRSKVKMIWPPQPELLLLLLCVY